MRVVRFLLLLLLLVLGLVLTIASSAARSAVSSPSAYWPGEKRGLGEPDYPRRVEVVDLVRGNAWYQGHLRDALREWNRCGADVRLVFSLDEGDAYTTGTITVFIDRDGKGQDGPYGGLAGDHGIVALAGGWTRSRDVIAHEVGHALGFGHGGVGIMGGGSRVDGVDCQGLRAYYG